MLDFSHVLVNQQTLTDPIFVVGCMRSGTGALARTIGLAESVCYVGETKLISSFYNRQVSITSAVRHWRNGEALLPVLKGKARRFWDRRQHEDLLRETIADMIRYTKLTSFDIKPSIPLVDRYGIDLSSSDTTLLESLYDKYKKLNSVDAVIPILFKDIQLVSQKPRILEKTPLHALYIPVIQRLFPDVKICHILRDGRQVAASYMLNYGQQKLNKRSIRYICTMHKYISAVDGRLREARNPNYYSLRYEDFVASPLTTLERVFNFLELPVSELVVRSLKDVRPGPSNWERLPHGTQIYVQELLHD